jgi:peptidyl-prolyl cis-trans isomerase B (cyclophilin B)
MKRILIALFICLGLAGFTSHAADIKPDADVAVITIKDHGQIVLELWSDVAPGHVENFKKLAKSGFYDGTASHRVIPGFMIQLGDPNTKDPSKAASFGQGGPGYTIKAEFNSRPHVRGVLSMARTAGGPDTAGSQFFICFNTASHLDGQYTAFVKLLMGEDVLAKLEKTPVRGSTPIGRVQVESIKIVPASSIK